MDLSGTEEQFWDTQERRVRSIDDGEEEEFVYPLLEDIAVGDVLVYDH